MDRRRFLETVAVAGALAGAPFVARAALVPPEADATQRVLPAATPVRIVHRADLAPCVAAAESLERELSAVGLAATSIAIDAAAFARFAYIDSIVAGSIGTRLVALLDDSGAVLLQQVAAARGGVCLEEAQLRFDGEFVRHCARRAGEGAARMWSEPLAGWPQRLARRHAEGLSGTGAQPLAAGDAIAPRRPGAAGIVSLVIAL
ncbi:MAG: twin-arginine translocation signal domain-containing protein [Burkholderiaceae bacterium]|nr:twin-arginine translocation signal domain-containing protein [Burkholderiaceae bacterium]